MRRLLLLLCALVLVGSACSTLGTAPAATVDGTEISAASVQDEMKVIRSNDDYRNALEQSYGSPTLGSAGKGTFDAAFVAQVLSLRLWYAMIEKDLSSRGIKVTKDSLDVAKQDMQQQFSQLGPKVFAGFPKQYQDQLIHQRALVDLVDQEISDQIGTDPKAFYDNNKDEFAEICLSHALVGVQNGTSPEAAKAKAQKLHDAIENGDKTFEEVATKESDDSAAAAQGGSLGCGSKSSLQFDPVFEAAAFKLKQGVLSEPVQTQFGSHLILVTKRTIPSYASVKDQVSTVMSSAHDERINAYLARIICGGKVDVNPRFGTWETSSCDSLTQQLPSVRPPVGPKGETTTTAPPQQ